MKHKHNQLFIREHFQTHEKVIGRWDRICDLDARIWGYARPYRPSDNRQPPSDWSRARTRIRNPFISVRLLNKIRHQYLTNEYRIRHNMRPLLVQADWIGRHIAETQKRA